MNWKLFHWKNLMIGAVIQIASGIGVLFTFGIFGTKINRWNPSDWPCNWSVHCIRRGIYWRDAERRQKARDARHERWLASVDKPESI